MLYYCSVVDEDSGAFVGAMVLDLEDIQTSRWPAPVDAVLDAAGVLVRYARIEVLYAPVPASKIPLPEIGVLLTREQLEQHFAAHGGVRRLTDEELDALPRRRLCTC